MVSHLVSICIPTYNGAKFLRDSLNSILNQTYRNLEIIFSDDSSTDSTLEIIESFIRDNPFRTKLLHHIPAGIGANWNNCIRHSKGEFIKFVFQDDILESDAIEKMVEVLHADKQIGLVTCKRNIIFEKGYDDVKLSQWKNVYGDLQRHLNLTYSPMAIIDRAIFRHKRFFKAPVNIIGEPSAVMFRANIIERIGLFSNDFKQYLDCEYWFRLLKISSIA
ncbi:MAG: glycosyltransferase family A protein, partial [Bacteroidota bacterium]